MVAEAFPFVDVRNMNLDKRNGYPGQRIAQGDTGMGEPARVDHDGIDAFAARGVDAINQFAFMVALEMGERGTRFLGLGDCGLLDFSERGRRTPQARVCRAG